MRQLSLILGIIAICGMIVGFIPCLGWFSWLNLPVAAVGLVLGAIDYNDTKQVQASRQYDPTVSQDTGMPLGLILCAIALVLGIFRLFIGGGII